MAKIKVRLRGKIVQELTLAPEKSYTAGRREDCDIVLGAEKGISREHFRLNCVEGTWTLEVLSKFGDVLLDGEKVEQMALAGALTFSLPPYEFDYSEVSTELVPVSQNSLATGDLEEKTFVGTAISVPYVKVSDEIGGTKELFQLSVGDTWIAGRDASCDIVIRDQRVSRRQFEIRRNGDQFLIIDLGSVNGTLLNGTPVSSAVATPLKSGDGINVLDNHLFFELHDPKFKERMQMVVAPAVSPLIANPVDYAPVPHMSTPSPMVNYQPGGGQYPTPHGYPSLHPQMSGGFNEPPAKKKFDFEKHRTKLIAGAVLFLAFAYYMSEQPSKGPMPASAAAGAAGKPGDAFTKLTPEQQILVKQTYQLAKNLYMQGKYELAKAEVAKIFELVPDYEDIKDIERLANEALIIQDQKRRQEELEAAKAETETKIQKQVAECKTKLNPNMTVQEMEDCLSPVLQFNPEHPAILELNQQVAELVSQKQQRDAEKQEYQGQVQKLRALYNKAEASMKEGQLLRAIKEFQVVTVSKLPDPNNYKSQARRQIGVIQQTLKKKIDQFTADAEASYKEQRLRDAILTLRKAVDVDPENQDTRDKIQKYTQELKKQMMVFYQEGILEESYGNVEGSESKPGAKDKWKKIIDIDIPDGEYYIKAKMKLKKYGAM
jgi:pSer/pThr/pTyr-binding forkhead associated (FHA) protein/tetratricopeptide (TPR) repeat protein